MLANLLNQSAGPVYRRIRETPLPYDGTAYKGRHLIEKMIVGFKDWWRIAIRYIDAHIPFFRRLYRCLCHLLSQLTSSEPDLSTIR